MVILTAKDLEKVFKIAIEQSTTTTFGVIAPVYLHCDNQQLLAPILRSDDIICDIGNCYDIKFISSFNKFTLADIYKLILFNFPYFSFYNVLEFL